MKKLLLLLTAFALSLQKSQKFSINLTNNQKNCLTNYQKNLPRLLPQTPQKLLLWSPVSPPANNPCPWIPATTWSGWTGNCSRVSATCANRTPLTSTSTCGSSTSSRKKTNPKHCSKASMCIMSISNSSSISMLISVSRSKARWKINSMVNLVIFLKGIFLIFWALWFMVFRILFRKCGSR